MKAAQITEYGDYNKLQISSDAPKPTLKPGQILVEVHASSINPIDLAIRNGYLAQMLPLEFPITLGGDFAGVVSEVGDEVKDFKVGDKVFGNAGNLKGGSGAWSEFVLAQAKNTSLKPTSVDFTESAALPLVGSSAIQAIEEQIKLKTGQKILIHGGAGGIGSIAIQLAKALGAFVATTVATQDIEFAKSLGADQVIDYKSEKFEEMIKEFDAVFDTVGGETTNKSIQILKKGGILVTMSGQPDEELANRAGVSVFKQMTEVSTSQLTRLAELVDSGKIKPQIAKTFTLDQAKEATEFQEKNHPKGKVVISIKN